MTLDIDYLSIDEIMGSRHATLDSRQLPRLCSYVRAMLCELKIFGHGAVNVQLRTIPWNLKIRLESDLDLIINKLALDLTTSG